MKLLLVAALGLFGSMAFAKNPFDAFVGEYLVEAPLMVRSVKAPSCVKYDFTNLTGVKIEAKTEGNFGQSHVITFVRDNGVEEHRVIEFSVPGEASGVSYGTTTGTVDLASHEKGFKTETDGNALTVAIEKKMNKYKFFMSEETVKQSALSEACYYHVFLKKVN